MDSMLSDSLKDVPSEYHVKLYHGGALGKFQSPRMILSSKFQRKKKKMKEERTDRKHLKHTRAVCKVSSPVI